MSHSHLAMDPHEFDDFGIHMSDHEAFTGGCRLTMEVVRFDGDQVFATPVTQGVQLTGEVRCAFPTWVSQYLDVGRRFTVVDFDFKQNEGQYVIQSKTNMLLPILHPLPSASGVAEAFAGVGGWTLGATLFGRSPTLMVERDHTVAMTCAKSHGIMCIDIDTAMMMTKEGVLPDHLVITASVTDVRIWFIASTMNIVHWMASPPCPPWSNAAHQKGLATEDGAVFIRFAYLLGLSRVFCATLENVPGLPKHPHFKYVVQAFNEAGISIVSAAIDKVTPLLPISRARWLATCVRNDIEVSKGALTKAKRIQIPASVPGIGKETSMGMASVVHSILNEWEIKQLLPTCEALTLMSKPALLPTNMRVPGYMNMSQNETLRTRIKSLRQILPNVMALQGSQHKLPLSLLESKGLHAWLISHDGRVRYTSPFEIAASMGMPHFMCLPKDFVQAWHVIGNSLSIAHAGLQCLRTKCIVGDLAGLGDRIHDALQLCEAIRAQLTKVDQYVVETDDEWMYMAPIESPTKLTAITIESDEDDDGEHFDQVRSPCRPVGISPTVPFRVEVPAVQHECGLSSKLLDPVVVPVLEPTKRKSVNEWALATRVPLEGADVLKQPRELESVDKMMVVHCLHSQHIWAATAQIPQGLSVGQAIMRVLPHATADHFVQVFVDDQAVWFETMLPSADECTITFQTCSFPKIVSACFLKKEQVVEVDVTWTCEDLIAYVASDAAVLPSAVDLDTEHGTCIRDSHVLASETTEYHAYFVAKEQPQQPLPAPGGSWKRVTVMHPKWSSMRTGVFADQATLLDAVNQLCVENFAPSHVTVKYPSMELAASTPLSACPGDIGSLQYDQSRREVAILVQEDKPYMIDLHDEIHVWVRSPFQCRPQIMKLPKTWTFMQLIHHVMHVFKGHLTLLVLVDGSAVQPKDLLKDVGPMKTVELRVVSLQGGAKGIDATTKALRDLLMARGVNTSDVDGRIHLIKTKIAASELTTMMTQSEVNAWSSLKAKANEVKLRLITSSELKEHQKSLRQHDKPPRPQNNPAGADNKPAKKSKKETKVVEKHVSIDPTHFQAGGERVVIIDDTRWGPDMKGVVITTPSVAMKRLPVAKISPDYLALVVVTSQPFQGYQPISVPAIDAAGKPTLAAVVVMNYGDIEVQCKPSVPSTDLAAVPTVIIELTVIREYVVQWEEVRNVLNYLGHHLPELRKGQVIASWAFKPYDASRTRCDHAEAHHVHGFIRVSEQVMIATLARSGHAGIFMQVKGMDKRPDSRFGIVVMHGKKLEEVLQQAAEHKQALGVIQLSSSGAFAIRARREDLQAIRSAVRPQSISLQEGTITNGATWWVLKNITVSTTCSDLTRALESLGWQASVVRPAGKTAWIACAVQDPPATHLCLGQDYVAVVPLVQMHAKQSEPPKQQSFVPLHPNVSMCPEEDACGATSASTTTRLSDMKADLEERLTEMINEKMQACDDRITTVASSIESVRSDLGVVVQESKKEFKELRDQQNSIQTQIQQNNSGMLTQMQKLFKQMQNELQTTLAPAIAEDGTSPKRSKVTS
eukprot:Skav219391  [mRNA]  locus=scaffold2133:129222:133865:+ [translate_table: standard]